MDAIPARLQLRFDVFPTALGAYFAGHFDEREDKVAIFGRYLLLMLITPPPDISRRRLNCSFALSDRTPTALTR